MRMLGGRLAHGGVLLGLVGHRVIFRLHHQGYAAFFNLPDPRLFGYTSNPRAPTPTLPRSTGRGGKLIETTASTGP